MEIFGLGKKKTQKFKFKKGDKVIYIGTLKKYKGKVMTVVSAEHDKERGNIYEVKHGKMMHNFSEKVLIRQRGLGDGLGELDGLGKTPKYTIQQVDQIAKKIQHNSGVKKTVTVKHYNISRKEAKEIAFEKVKSISPKAILKSIK